MTCVLLDVSMKTVLCHITHGQLAAIGLFLSVTLKICPRKHSGPSECPSATNRADRHMAPVPYDDPLHSIFCLQPSLLPWKSIGSVHSSERIRALERLPQSWDTQQATMKKAMDPILKFRRSLLRSPNLFPAFAVARQSLLDIAPAIASQEFGMHSCVYNHRGC